MSAEVLLAGSVGALLVFVLGAVREWLQDERERRGLLVVLLAEIEHNAIVLHAIWERIGYWGSMVELLGQPDITQMKASSWHDVRGRATVLLPNHLLTLINDYYSPLEVMLSLAQLQGAAEEGLAREVEEVAREAAQRYGWQDEERPPVRNRYREAMHSTFNAGDDAMAAVRGHLRLKWREAALLAVARIIRWASRAAQR